ncbi:hypothetical protein AB1Y20_007103 [Prymnesium parvum]|uniref:PH domain-containing protein n=1 Tax=Prymnesium parvum TaxID=97485 RepID=A0AB34J0D5_PRYPA
MMTEIEFTGFKKKRAPTAIAGIEMLKKGCTATKYSRSGKPRLATFRLSSDESTLSWDAGRYSLAGPVKMYKGERRNVKITEILELLIGMDSKVFALYKDIVGEAAVENAHISLSLVLLGNLPSTPTMEGDESSRAPVESRETLDISFDNEENFGLWVAALRALMYETEPMFFSAYAFPASPINFSALESLRSKAPTDASRFELFRDFILYMETYKIWQYIAVVWGINVVGWGILCGLLIFGWTGIEPYAPDEWGQNYTIDGKVLTYGVDYTDYRFSALDYFNAVLQVLTGLFTYVTLLTLPWRLSNGHHLWLSSRSHEVGCDFYGRKSEGMWWNISVEARKKIVAYALLNSLFTLLNQLCHIIWHSYKSSNDPLEGLLPTILTFIAGLVCGIRSGYLQTKSENEVKKAYPGRFPPTKLDYEVDKLKKRWVRWKVRQEVARDIGFIRSHRQSSDLGASEVAASEDEGGGFRGASTASTTSSLASGNDNGTLQGRVHTRVEVHPECVQVEQQQQTSSERIDLGPSPKKDSSRASKVAHAIRVLPGRISVTGGRRVNGPRV